MWDLFVLLTSSASCLHLAVQIWRFWMSPRVWALSGRVQIMVED